MTSEGVAIKECLVCHSGGSRLYFHAGESELRQCTACGFVFLAVHPASSDKIDLNNQRYEHSARPVSAARRRLQKREDSECLDQIEKFARPGRLLDVGCAAGDFIKLARVRGWDVRGIELDEGLASQAASKVGSERVHAGTLDTCPIPAGSIDVVVMRSVVEHLLDPRAVLGQVRSLLAPGGRIFILVPNIKSFESWLYGPRWFALTPGDHVWFFSPATLTAFLKECGFSADWLSTSESFRDALVGVLFALFVGLRDLKRGRRPKTLRPAEAANARSTGFVGQRVSYRVVALFETAMEVARIITWPLFAVYARMLTALGRGASTRGVFLVR